MSTASFLGRIDHDAERGSCEFCTGCILHGQTTTKPHFINPLREIGFVYVPKARAVLIIATSVCRYLRVSKHSHGCQCLAMSMSARLLHATAHGLCGHPTSLH